MSNFEFYEGEDIHHVDLIHRFSDALKTRISVRAYKNLATCAFSLEVKFHDRDTESKPKNIFVDITDYEAFGLCDLESINFHLTLKALCEFGSIELKGNLSTNEILKIVEKFIISSNKDCKLSSYGFENMPDHLSECLGLDIAYEDNDDNIFITLSSGEINEYLGTVITDDYKDIEHLMDMGSSRLHFLACILCNIVGLPEENILTSKLIESIENYQVKIGIMDTGW